MTYNKKKTTLSCQPSLFSKKHLHASIWVAIGCVVLAACVNEIPGIEPDGPSVTPSEELHTISLSTRSGVGVDVEAAYPHTLLVFRNSATGVDAPSIQATQAASASAIQPLKLANGAYKIAMMAVSNPARLVFTPAIATGSTLATTVTLSGTDTPDILLGTASFSVSQTGSQTITLNRLVGRVVIKLTGVPATPAVQTISVNIDGLADRFDLNGLLSTSGAFPAGVSRNVALTPVSGTPGAYATATTDGVLLLPSLLGASSLPLTLSIKYADNSVSNTSVSLAGHSIRSGYTTTINLKYAQPQGISVNYTAWQYDEIDSDIVVDGTTPTTPTEPTEPTVPTTPANIGTLVDGGILFATGKVMALTQSSTSLAWSLLSVPIAVATTSPDGELNYNTFASYANEVSNRWDKHPAYKYTEDLRTTTNKAWYLPSKEEWAEISAHLTVINAALSANGGTPINAGSSYWTSSEQNSDIAYCITPSSGTVASITKSQYYLVRAIRKVSN